MGMTIEEPTTKNDLGVDSTPNTISFKEMTDNLKITAEDIENAEDLEYSIEPLLHPKNNLGVDCISRDDVWDVMQELWGTSGELIDRLMSLPSVTPQEPKTGHWIDKNKNTAVCSCCNRNNTLYGDFCKWCGAKMVEPQESEVDNGEV